MPRSHGPKQKDRGAGHDVDLGGVKDLLPAGRGMQDVRQPPRRPRGFPHPPHTLQQSPFGVISAQGCQISATLGLNRRFFGRTKRVLA